MFDPYHTWLGIPPKDQPPDHYRVLGIERFEANPTVIANAADRQMSHVRSVGRQHEQHQAAVLSRLSTARVCLLDVDDRQQYDRMLLESSRIEQAKAFDRPPMPGPTKLDQGVIPAVKPVDSRPPKPSRLDQETADAIKTILIGIFAAILVAGIVGLTVIELIKTALFDAP